MAKREQTVQRQKRKRRAAQQKNSAEKTKTRVQRRAKKDAKASKSE